MKDQEMSATPAHTDEVFPGKARPSWEEAMALLQPEYDKTLRAALDRGIPEDQAHQTADIWHRVQVERLLEGTDEWVSEALKTE